MGHLSIMEGGVENRKVGLGKTPITLGREKDNTLSLPGTRISRYHCRILPDRLGGWRLIDLGSANGTRLNGKRVLDAALYHGDQIEVGDYTLVLCDPSLERPLEQGLGETATPLNGKGPGLPEKNVPKLVARGGGMDRREIPLTGGIRIGRGAGNDLCLNQSQVSGKHARLVPARGGFRVEDLGSTNGTRVNGNLIKNHLLGHGDEMEIGNVRFLYLAPDQPAEAPLETFHKRRMDRERLFALVGESGREEWKIAPLPFTVGTLPDNQLVFDDDSLSGHHARFFMEDRHLHLEDVGSSNGTFLNGQRIDKARVGHGAEVEFGRLYFLVRDVDYPFPRLEKGAPSRRWVIAASLVLVLLAGAIVAPFLLKGHEEDDGGRNEVNRLRKNASFEEPSHQDGSLPGWRLTGAGFVLDHQEAAHGTTSLQVKLTSTASKWAKAEATYLKPLEVEPGRTYTVAARLRAKYTPGVAGIRIDWYRKDERSPFDRGYSDLVTGDTAWLKVETHLTAPPGARTAILSLVAVGNGGTDWFDDVRFAPASESRSSSLRKVGAGRLRARLNRRGMATLTLSDSPLLSRVGLVFWDRKRAPKASQTLCLPAPGYPRSTAEEFCLRAEAVKLAEGLPIPFEVRAAPTQRGVELRYRCHADAGYLAVGDRIAVAIFLLEPVRGMVLSGEGVEEKLGRSSFGSVANVSTARLMTEAEELILRFDPAMTVNGLEEPGGDLVLYASVGMTQADLGRILEVTLDISLPPAKKEARAQDLLVRAGEQIKAKRLGRAYALYERVETEYRDVEDAAAEARSRRASIEAELDRHLGSLNKALKDFQAGPSAASLSVFLFRVDETENMFKGMESARGFAELRESALEIYGRVAGPGFQEARKALAEARAAYETGDWVRAETLCARILSEMREESMAPGARAVLSEIKRRREDREEMEAWVEGRLRAAKELEARDEMKTAKEIYREILRRYPQGEWARLSKEQIRRLGG